ncbi:hypothetical protein BT67DRAFT_262960 [Trichocladium antarcticum]|uniref:Uncharacterized protein n=1 Tax=Trichocladium antarcticum TaxID=1450529 RepID=A0AAN6UNA8_9PEZI|nr:hypothetical protein BT67DRAFT_262960 [Trichocladium antarcticum]
MAHLIQDFGGRDMVSLHDRTTAFLVALGRFYPNGSWNPQSIFGIVVAEEQNVFARIFEAGHRQPYSVSLYYLKWAVDFQLWRQYIEPVSGHPFRPINDMPARALAPGGRYCQRFEFYCAQRRAMEAQRAGGPANIARNPAVAGHVNMAPPGAVAGHVNMAPPGVIAGGQANIPRNPAVAGHANIAHNPAAAGHANAAPPGVTTRRPINVYHNQAVVGQFQVGPADAVAAGGQATNADSPAAAAAGTSVYVIVAGEGSVRPVRSQSNNASGPAAAANVPATPPAAVAGEGGPRVAGAAEPLDPAAAAQADNNLRLSPRAGPAGVGGGGDAPAVSGSSAGLRGAAGTVGNDGEDDQDQDRAVKRQRQD